MGAAPTRISASDFVTPPELRPWQLAAHTAGRIGGVRLELLADASGTHLGACYQQVPLRVLPPFRFAADRPTLLYLLNPTAGLLDGDGHLVELTARAGSRAVVVGQSATRIHPSVACFSTQQWRIRAEAGSVLVILPGPAIPFQASRYYQRVEIDLEPEAGLIWGDIWLAGRYARGSLSELFQFTVLVQELTVRRAGKLVFRDRFWWRGPWDRDTARWHFGDNMASGSLFVTGAMPVPAPSCTGPPQPAAFETAFGDTCLRWCGSSEAVTQGVVAAALSAATSMAGGTWRLDQELAPVHWFSLAAAATPSPEQP
jgi:urease accessory protein